MELENVVDGASGGFFYLRVGIHKRNVQAAGKSSTDGRLAHPHQTHQYQGPRGWFDSSTPLFVLCHEFDDRREGLPEWFESEMCTH